MLTHNAIIYTLAHLLRVAFPNFHHTIETDGSRAETQVAGIRIIFPLMDNDAFKKMMEGRLPSETLTAPSTKEIPAFRISDENGIYTIDNKSVILHYDFVSLPFVMLSRADELLATEYDVHHRSLYRNSIAAKYSLIDFPVVDEYAFILRAIIQKEFPEIQIVPRKSTFISTHDIDLINRFGNFYTNVRTLAADLLKYRSRGMFKTSMAQYSACRRDELKDPYILAAEMLLKEDLAAKRRSLFFFKSLRKDEPDATYDIFGAQAAHLIRTITEKGGEIGLHGSYYSYDHTSRLNKERLYLENVAECRISQGRQHYLRFDIRTTPTVWQNGGIINDYTIGYAEREGFRCGTCHPYPLYDIANDRPLQVTEHPLIAMDGTFLQYRKFTPEQALQKIRQLHATCNAVEGDFILLWHNTLVWREYLPWYEGVFMQL